MGNITKSLQTNIAAATAGIPGSTDVLPFLDLPVTALVTPIKKCTVADLLPGLGLAITLGQVAVGTGTGVAGSADLTFASNVLTIAGDVVVGDGKAFGPDTTTAHTAVLRAYDVNGTAYKTFLTLTNGDTPDMTIAPPSGGTVVIQATTYKSSDGTEGETATILAAGLVSITVKNGLVTAHA